MTRETSWLTLLPLIALFLATDTATQLAFKAVALTLDPEPLGLQLLQVAIQTPFTWIAGGFYLATYVLWIAILKEKGLAEAFPLTALSYVTVPAGGWLIFGESIGALPALGIGLICAGVCVIGAPSEDLSQFHRNG